MAEPKKKRRAPKKTSHPGSSGGLFGPLKQAHDASHEILDALGIKHPHVPVLSAVEMLDHLREKHVDEPNA
jgi:hypothetical protein